jgi:arabinogalactan oligomer/maltooligosaccharide transport system substrate-binding protein
MKRVLVMAAAVAALGLASAQGKITVWYSWSDSGEVAWLKDQASRFEKTTGTKVELVNVPFGDIPNKFILGAPQGQAADIVLTLPHDQLGALAAAGVLEPMKKYATSGYLNSLADTTVDAASYKGTLVGLPMAAEAVTLIYNKKLVKTPPKTWDEFLKVAQDNTKGNTFGFLYDLGNSYFNYGWLSAYGGGIFGKTASGALDEGKLLMGGDAGEKAVGFAKDLRYKYKLIPEGVDYGVADSAFKEGALAMILNGPWALGDYKKAKIDFGVALMPAPPGASKNFGPFLGVQVVVMNAYSKNKTAAANFAKTLVTTENQVSFNKSGGRIPVSKEAVSRLSNDPVVAGFSAAIAVGTPMPNIPEMGKVWGPWGNGYAQAIQKSDSNVAKIVADLTAEIRKGISEK